MKDLFMNDNETYDLRHDHNDGTMMEDMSSYRPGDSLAETEVSSSQQPNHRFIVSYLGINCSYLTCHRRDSAFGRY